MTDTTNATSILFGLLQTALGGALLAGIVFLTTRLLPRLPHAWRAGLWWMVSARFVFGLTGVFLLSPSPALMVRVPAFWSGLSGIATPPTFPSPLPGAPLSYTTGMANFPANRKPNANGQNTQLPVVEPSPINVPNLSQILLCVWAVGLLFRGAVSGTHYARLRKRLRAARLVTANEPDVPPARALWQAATLAAQEMRRACPPRLLLSAQPIDPFVTGWFRPSIVLCEADLARLSPFELRLVLCHEMAHLKRGDLFWGMVPHLALHLFWFWPPAYYACREWSLACEAFCDALAARATQTSPRTYGELLLKLGALQTTAAPFFAALPVSVHFRLLQRRLIMLDTSSSVTPLTRRRRALTALGGAALLVATVPIGLLSLRFDATPALASDGVPYTTNNGDTGKPWASYPDAPRNLNFTQGIEDWQPGKDDKAHGYSASVQKINAPTNSPSGLLTASAPQSGEFGYLVQYARPGALRGKRIRFSAWLRTENAQGAGFWLRMDTPNWQKAWNKLNAPILGTTDWKQFSYVFDVPKDAQGFAFGTDLAGSGKVWLHAPSFTVVDKTVAVSLPGFDSSPEAQTESEQKGDRTFALDFDTPTNLNFKNGLVGWWNDNPDHSAARDYATGLDGGAGRVPGEDAAFLKNKTAKPTSYGTLAQNTQAKNLRGKRVHFSTWIKTENAQASGFWIVVHAGENSSGYNRNNNPITGTTPWTKYEATIDIPRDAEGVSFGLDLTGTGKIWTDGFVFETVGDAPESGTSGKTASEGSGGRNPISGINWSKAPASPTNLDFSAKLTGWWKSAPNSNAPDYEAGIDDSAKRDGGVAAPAFLQAAKASPSGYGTLMQNAQAGDFKNRRVRFSGFIKTEAVKDARLWIRLDTRHDVSAWNMGKHPLEGTNGWTRVEYVFDVPADAEGMAYGISLDGPGKAWADGFHFETVGPDVPVTPAPGG